MRLLDSKQIEIVSGGVSPFAIPGANWATLFGLTTKAVADSLGTSLLTQWYDKEPIPTHVKAITSGLTAAIGLYVGFVSYAKLGSAYMPST
ncbi:MAG: hypothetical protein U1E78_11105 [Gammaproteobacteria bacterium]